jgi:hypothetical protein
MEVSRQLSIVQISNVSLRLQVVSKNSALLSNYEVLTLLRELESDQLAKARSHLAAKKEEEGAALSGHPVPPVAGNPTQDEVPQNLRTVEVEVSELLCRVGLPLIRNSLFRT